ncbi:hypothetical protein MASR1M32_25290 [Rhodobacter sp.]
MALALPGQGVLAQETVPPVAATPIVVTLDAERFFRESAWGQEVIRRFEAEREALGAENRRIEEALQKEEQDLTTRRATMPPAEFSHLAADFDTRVEGIRAAQDAKSQALIASRETQQRAFFNAARPVLEAMLQEIGASAILAAGAVLVAADETDITPTAILWMDRAHPDAPSDESLTPDAPPEP